MLKIVTSVTKGITVGPFGTIKDDFLGSKIQAKRGLATARKMKREEILDTQKPHFKGSAAEKNLSYGPTKR